MLRREDHRCSRKLRWLELQQGCVQHGHLHQVLCVEEYLVVVHDRVEAAVALQESVCTGRSDTEVKHLQDLLLHLEYHGLGEFVLADLQEVRQLRWVDLLILGRNEQRGHSKQVQLTLLNALFAHELIYDVLADV